MRRFSMTAGCLICAVSVLACTADTEAGGKRHFGSYGSCGSSGSSWGSYGSSGSSGSSSGSWGSSGSHGSSGSWGSGGSTVVTCTTYSSCGSQGSYSSLGSCGSTGSYSSHGSYGSAGSTGSYGSHGSSGSYGSHGSSGGSYGSYGSSGVSYTTTHSNSSYTTASTSVASAQSIATSSTATRAVVVQSTPQPQKATPPVTRISASGIVTMTRVNEDGVPVTSIVQQAKNRTSTRSEIANAATTTGPSEALLVVEVPEDATVYLVGQAMKVTGAQRRFRIPVATAGRDYSYPVRVEVQRDGEILSIETVELVSSGSTTTIRVSEEANHTLTAVASR